MLYGRLPRARSPAVPHLSALLAGVTLPPLPAAIDYTAGMPASLGVMLNDSEGDCTCAGCGHAEQVWSFNATPPLFTPSDSAVQALYEQACGYVPGQPNTDQGGVEQDVLTYWLKNGFAGRSLAAFVEVDPRNLDDLRRVIYDCGVAYIGFDIPAYLENGLTAPNSVWDVNPDADNSVIGSHCIVLAGYDENGNFRGISWGDYYTLTAAFLLQRMDEAYGLVAPDWIATTGKTPAGLILEQWQQQMIALQEQGT
jgi:hypothetical protein